MTLIRVRLSLTALALSLAACATTTKITRKADPFAGGQIATTDPLPVVAQPDSKNDCGNVDVCIQFKKTLTGTTAIYEALVSDGGEFKRPVDALKTDSLSFNIDGDIVSLSTEVNARDTEASYPGFLSTIHTQRIPYGNIPEAVLSKLAVAREVKVRLKGAEREKVGYLRPVSFAAVGNLIGTK